MLFFPERAQRQVLEFLAAAEHTSDDDDDDGGGGAGAGGAGGLSPEAVLEELKRRRRCEEDLFVSAEEEKVFSSGGGGGGGKNRVRLELETKKNARRVVVVRRDAGPAAVLAKAKQVLRTKRVPRVLLDAATGVRITSLDAIQNGTVVRVDDDDETDARVPIIKAARAADTAQNLVVRSKAPATRPPVDNNKKNRSPPAFEERRSRLPAAAKRAEIIQVCRAHRVVVIAGATGCGKSTQVPQFLLEDAEERGEDLRIVVTQPRRVAAVALAERVNLERGGDVGYAVRLERTKRPTSLEYATVGVLLQRVQTPDYLRVAVDVVVVDEAHERDCLTDFLLVVLKQQQQHVRVVIMSATLDAEVFLDYFPGAPFIRVPGREFEVRERYLEHLAGDLGIIPPKKVFKPHHHALDCDFVARVAVAVERPALVFVASVKQVEDVCRRAREGGADVVVLPLHASLAPAAQRRVFEPRPDKVIVATNVAETSITIDDVATVVDSGRVRERRFDRLEDAWVSKAAARQRAGRAGRVKPGTVWRLYPRARFDSLAEHTEPEITRSPLEDIALRVLRLGLGQPRDVLSRAPQPPATKAVDEALATLEAVGAARPTSSSSSSWELTPLGWHIADLPVACRVAKLLIVGSALGCVEAALTIGSVLSASRDLFFRYDGKTQDLAKCVEIYEAWVLADRKFDLCKSHSVCSTTMWEVHRLRAYYRSRLEDAGWSTTGDAKHPALLGALICAGMYPNIARYDGQPTGPLVDKNKTRWYCHPSSANFEELRPRKKYASRRKYVVFASRMETSKKKYLWNTTIVSPLAIVLFGGKGVDISHDTQSIVVDRWLTFKTTSNASLVLAALRRKIDALLLLRRASPLVVATVQDVLISCSCSSSSS
ncbi:hypothetical protein CTAYLR_000150 [Chrysophaeum taylorii]|uniref:RNA helicase n=1 Tax=Chrysophaeum taylorii TaxID=2483200 RepID=A0AAD7UGQ7_9STRA|nr:hypothetical protein CTAYLR_000150 [Chrysophaeum taylorii]